MWAWLRYGPAIANSTDLRLISQWDSLDPHQKTVLSDDFGVGFTTQLFAELLDFRLFADTNYVLQLIKPPTSIYKVKSKRGPSKTPDFVVLDANDNLSILECKGSQHSLDRLRDAVSDGVVQKGNLNLQSSLVKHRLSAGLFIPQNRSADIATLYIKDPPSPMLEKLLSSISFEDLKVSIIQVALAKEFALMGMDAIANALVDTQILYDQQLAVPVTIDLSRSRRRESFIVFEHSLPLPYVNTTFQGTHITRVNFTMECPRDRYTQIIESNDLRSELLKISESMRNARWSSESTDFAATVWTPLGFKVSLEYEPIKTRRR